MIGQRLRGRPYRHLCRASWLSRADGGSQCDPCCCARTLQSQAPGAQVSQISSQERSHVASARSPSRQQKHEVSGQGSILARSDAGGANRVAWRRSCASRRACNLGSCKRAGRHNSVDWQKCSGRHISAARCPVFFCARSSSMPTLSALAPMRIAAAAPSCLVQYAGCAGAARPGCSASVRMSSGRSRAAVAPGC